MSKQSIGLAAFAQKTVTRSKAATEAPQPNERERGKGDKVSLTVRLNRSDWERLHQLAVSEGASIQTLAVRGLSKIFAEKGLPGI
ncbi:conserved hypothetical protein [Candidatus Glomeribacter gigasporarum BEG34]|uniref:Uncharacterized protein n=1 Tax=Candidatus Glomeribacter gigasporarum BEG34 TaxID=1070319 RepID=G2JBP3_9BURK|nr:hypothetical protein [Candidatus Glomeribacter gigasporarum]CCD30197.1 conserved hypothetical protein [Candidatus Glomeribacter gigasporarum BEG34]